MREIIEAMQAKMRETGEPVAYCTGGHGHTYVDVETVALTESGEYADAHGACPGPVIVIVPNPDAEVEVIQGGVQREAPPCGRCGMPTEVTFADDPVEVLIGVVTGSPPEALRTEEWSFTLQEASADGLELRGDPMTVCIRCLAGALAAPTPFALIEIRGRTVPWRR